MSQRDFEILLIEPDKELVDEIINSFADTNLSLSFAETKSLTRAESLISSDKINFVIFGPSLNLSKISEFFQKFEIKYKIPSLYIYTVNDEAAIQDLLNQGISEAVLFPFIEEDKSKILDNIVNSFKKKAVLNLDSSHLLKSKVNKTKQLAIILDRLAFRIEKVSNELKKVPSNKDLVDISIPEAVNKVILGSTQFRKEKEDEDIEKLINSIVKDV